MDRRRRLKESIDKNIKLKNLNRFMYCYFKMCIIEEVYGLGGN